MGPPRDMAAADAGPPPMPNATVIGWASQAGGTRGGEGGPTVSVTSISMLNSQASDNTARIIQVSGNLSGNVSIGSNKTIIGMAGATVRGTVEISGSTNVILKNLKVVGGSGDAVSVSDSDHVWIDHCDISDAGDGNLDITNASDYITVSWTKFSYSSSSGDHRFSNLIGSGDTETGDRGRLRVTMHANWWANNVYERMPRVRFGQVHLFNNLYTAAANAYCIRAGVESQVLSENNAFISVSNPFDIEGGVIQSRGDLFQSAGGRITGSGTVPNPPYPYTPAAASTVAAAIMAGAGPR
jgi:pectate lyase